MSNLPHTTLFEWALDENRKFNDVYITKEGDVITILRPLSLKERIDILKSIAHFYAPALKSVEATAKVDVSNLSTDELEKMATQLLADTIKKERKAAH